MNKKIITLIFIILYSATFAECYLNNYDQSIGFDYLYYAKASYCDKKDIADWSCDACQYHPGLIDVKVITNLLEGAQLYVGYDPKNNLAVVAFRGSENIQNWVANVDFKKTSYPYCSGCKVHAGFNRFWGSVSDETLAHYQKIKSQYPKSELLITGHSLGAAVATLATLEFINSGYKVDHYITFGCPRVGNEEFAAYADQQLPQGLSVIHYKDPVPHLPLAAQGFTRVNTEIFYNKKDSATSWEACPAADGQENKHCSNKFLVDKSINDHLHYLGIYTGCTLEMSVQQTMRLALKGDNIKLPVDLEYINLDSQEEEYILY